VSDQFGPDYPRKFLCVSLYHFTHFLPTEILNRNARDSEDAQRTKIAKLIANQLIKENVAIRLLKTLERKVVKVMTFTYAFVILTLLRA